MASRLFARLLCPLFVLCLIQSVAGQEKRRIAIYDFDYSAVQDMVVKQLGPNYNIGKVVASAFLSPLTESGAFEVVDRTRMQQLFKEQNLKFSDRFDPAQAISYGKVLSVDAIVTGTIDSFSVENVQRVKGLAGIGKKVALAKASVGITAQIISTETAQIYMAPHVLGQSSDELSNETSGGIAIPGLRRGQPQSGSSGTSTTRDSWEPTVRGAIDKAVQQVAQDMVAKAPGLPRRTPSPARVASRYTEGASSKPGAGGATGSSSGAKALKAAVVDVSSGLVFIDKGGAAGVQKGDHFEIRRFLKTVANSQGKMMKLDRKVGELQITEVSDEWSSGTYTGEGQPLKGDSVVRQ